MSKGRYQSKMKNTKLMWLIGVLAVLLAVLLVFAWSLSRNQPEQTQPTQLDHQTQPTGQTQSGTAPTTDFSNFGELDMEPEVGQNEQSQGETQGSEQATTAPVDATDPAEVVTQPPVVIVEQAKADYERWLAATMLISISMEYPDFEIAGIYLASETTLENKMSSKGCYIIFSSSGETMAVHSTPLEGERTAAGTKDISSQTMGFATFDMVDPASVNTSAMIEVSMEDLGELISQSLLVSIYAH